MKLLHITNKLLNEFLPSEIWYGFKNINKVILNCIDKNNIKPIDHSWYQSGGGICHYFILDIDNHIWSFHICDEIHILKQQKKKSKMVFMVLGLNLKVQIIMNDLVIKNKV